MRHITRMMAAMLVFGCVTATSSQANAYSIWYQLIDLTGVPQQVYADEFMLKNFAPREVKFVIHGFDRYDNSWDLLGNLDVPSWGVRYTYNNYHTVRVRLKVWNKNKKRWVLQDELYMYGEGPWYIEANKYGTNDFRLFRWYDWMGRPVAW